MRPQRRLLLAVTVLVLALAVTITVSAPSKRPSPSPSNGGFDGSMLPEGLPAHPFTLIDQDGRHIDSSAYRGRVAILVFLNSACGAPCFLTAQQIRGALDELGPGAPTLLISTDPGADTPARVHRFLERTSLAGRVQYLTGTPSQLQSIAQAYGLLPASTPATKHHRGLQDAAGRLAAAPASSTYVVLIDRLGAPRVEFTIEQLTPEALAHDVRRLERG